jgi:hypothetical protein
VLGFSFRISKVDWIRRSIFFDLSNLPTWINRFIAGLVNSRGGNIRGFTDWPIRLIFFPVRGHDPDVEEIIPVIQTEAHER